MTTAKAAFEVTGWDQQETDVVGVARATVKKTFTGDVIGESTAELVLTQNDDGRGYVAIDHVVAEVHGRSGTFVFQHGGVQGGDLLESFGTVIPGSGTGGLAGITGTASLAHDDTGAVFTLNYELPS
jgi:hypothetical protein